MPVLEAIAETRTRFNRCRAGKPFSQLQKDIGISRATLTLFAAGGGLKPEKVHIIEQWCARQEEARHDAAD